MKLWQNNQSFENAMTKRKCWVDSKHNQVNL